LNTNLMVGLLFAAMLAVTAVQGGPPVAEDPCAVARHIARSAPCLAGSTCAALERWRAAFGAPRSLPVGAGALPAALAAPPTVNCPAR